METEIPNTAHSCIDLGDHYRQRGCLAQALALYRQAVNLKPDSVRAVFKTAMTLQLAGKSEAAAKAYRQCLVRDPSLATAWNNLGGILKDAAAYEQALVCFSRAVALDPNLAQAHFNLGYLFEKAGRIAEALGSYENALALEPENAKICSQLVFLMQASCTWLDIERLACRLDAMTRRELAAGGSIGETPFKNIARTEDAALNAAVARFWAGDLSRRTRGLNHAWEPRAEVRTDPRIRIGYLSDRFRNAATAHQMLSLFGLHNREEYFTIAYSYGENDGSIYRRRIEQDSDRFVDIAAVGDPDAAQCIRRDRVDILIDLKGHTENNRLGISARHPAPLQATWLGFPGTSGAEFFDYVICDRIVLPDFDRRNFSEQPVWLPHCYYPTDFRQPVAQRSWERSDFGLPRQGVVLCCFNQSYKIDAMIFDCWMSVMARVPGAVLWLQEKNARVTANLRQEAGKRGIDPKRLVFARLLPKDQHLARLRLADLCLDTRTYNGHTTTADALWAGVPVVTLQGAHFASRVSASILSALGMVELITHTVNDYRELALHLASDGETLRRIRQKIAYNRHREPLFNTHRFVRNLERAFEDMWRIHQQGERPRPLAVGEVP